TFDDNFKVKTYYPVSCLGNKVPYKDKVIGIIDSNSQLDNEVYLHHSIMEKMINEQVEKYQKNEIEINYNIFEGNYIKIAPKYIVNLKNIYLYNDVNFKEK